MQLGVVALCQTYLDGLVFVSCVTCVRQLSPHTVLSCRWKFRSNLYAVYTDSLSFVLSLAVCLLLVYFPLWWPLLQIVCRSSTKLFCELISRCLFYVFFHVCCPKLRMSMYILVCVHVWSDTGNVDGDVGWCLPGEHWA